MAGATLAPIVKVDKYWEVFFEGPIKSGDLVNQGCMGSIDTSGNIVEASKTQGGTVHAEGVLVFNDARGYGDTTRTGVAAGTVRASLARRAILSNLDGTLVPSIDDGLRAYLGPLPTSTVSNYTAAQSTTANDLIQPVGFFTSPTTAAIVVNPTMLKYQSTASSLVNFV